MSQVTDIIHSASEPPVLNQVVDPRFHTVAEFSDLHSPRAALACQAACEVRSN